MKSLLTSCAISSAVLQTICSSKVIEESLGTKNLTSL